MVDPNLGYKQHAHGPASSSARAIRPSAVPTNILKAQTQFLALDFYQCNVSTASPDRRRCRVGDKLVTETAEESQYKV